MLSAFIHSHYSALRRDKHLCLKLAAGGITLALAIAVAVLRFYRLSELPPGLYFDEGIDGILALKVLQGEHAVFFPVDQGREASAIYTLALSILLLGRTLLATHLPTALGSAGMVFVLFWLGKILFERDESGRATPWRGIWVGGVGAGLLAVSLSQTIIGRTGYNKTTHMPLLLCLCLGLLWEGWRERSWWRIALAGLCAGLLPYTYIPARFVPFLFLFFALSFAQRFRRNPDSDDEGAKQHKHDSQKSGFEVDRERGEKSPSLSARLQAALPQAVVFGSVAGLVAAPLLIHFALHPDHFFLRSDQVWVFDASRSQGAPLKLFLLNVWDHLLVFGFRGDPNWRHNFASQPMLNIWEALFFWLGAGMSVRRWQQPAYRLLLLWLAVLFLPVILARDTPPNTLRMMGVAPAIYLLTGVGAWEAFRFLRSRFWRNKGTRTAIAVGSVATVLILVQGVGTFHTYFHKWANAPELDNAFEVVETELARTLSAQPSGPETVYLIPSHYKYYGDEHRHHGFEFLYTGAASVHFIHPALPGLAQKIESALTAREEVSTVKVMDWNTNVFWIEDDPDRFAFLLSKYGRYLSSDVFTDYQFHNYVDLSLNQAWTFYEQLTPLTVDYDGGITLTGVAMGQAMEQLSPTRALILGRNRPLWIVLQWQTSPLMSDIDYVISLRLYNTENVRAFQTDDVLWNPDHWPTSRWSMDEPVETLHLVELPTDLPPGDYELRMVVYDFETQTPTVEIDVWEAEKTLARVRLTEAQR